MKQEPPLQPAPTADDRKTAELCGHEYAGARCMRRHGHDGRHECQYWQGERVLRWD